MILCPEHEKRLDAVWSKLQQSLWEPHISQIDLDEKCLTRLEGTPPGPLDPWETARVFETIAAYIKTREHALQDAKLGEDEDAHRQMDIAFSLYNSLPDWAKALAPSIFFENTGK